MLKILYLNHQNSFDMFFEDVSISKINLVANLNILGDSDQNLNSEELSQYDILMGAWGSPMLPEDYKAPAGQLYVMVTGTVAGQVKINHLENGLRLSNWGDAISHTIAESALLQILTSLRGVGSHFNKTYVEKSWLTEKGPKSLQTLFRKNVGLLGFGAIAQKLVPLLKPFEAKVSFYDPYTSDDILKEHPGAIRYETVEELFANNHIISNHCANIPETNNLINQKMLSLLPDNGIIVNTARGNSLDEEALAKEHQKGRLWSCLDVYREEPVPKDHPLRNEVRCVMLCHQAGPTLDCYNFMGERATENIIRFNEKRELLGEISSDQLRRMT
jgi:phosphoglycerate dehydrogenase-like enzyme